MPRPSGTKRAAVKARSWCSPWLGQVVRTCSTCHRHRTVMLIENDAVVCAECHEERLRRWRLDDEEAERTEALWAAWDLIV